MAKFLKKFSNVERKQIAVSYAIASVLVIAVSENVVLTAFGIAMLVFAMVLLLDK